MNKIYLLFVCCFLSLAASAVVTTYPISVSAPYGGTGPTGICQNSGNTGTVVAYSVCPTTTPGAALQVLATWYLNGAIVYSDLTPHTIAAGGGTIALPAAAFTYSTYGTYTGSNGLYCVLSWTSGASPLACGSLTSVQGASTDITVNEAPGPILGIASVCSGYTTPLSDTAGVGFGTWSSSSTTVASISFSSGLVTGNSSGTVHITYTMPSACFITTVLTVNQTPVGTTGATNLCTGTLTAFHDGTSGGTWASNNDAVATIGSNTGSLIAQTPGTALISYTMNSGCFTTTEVTVNQMPTAIIGAGSLCAGSTIIMSDSITGGIWTSSNTAAATIVFNTGVLSGVAAGTTRISYTMGSACTVVTVVTVNQTPVGISGVLNLCSGALTTLTDATTGGNWASSDPTIATIGASTGSLTAVDTGTATITYTLGDGCRTTASILVNQSPSIIVGPNAVCSGYSIGLYDSVSGGVWTSGATGVATVDFSSGLVTAVAASGTARISYTLGSGCVASLLVSVNPLPAAIAGVASVCVGSITSFSDATAAGTWSSTNSSLGTVGTTSGFVVSGASSGLDTVYYTINATGCYRAVVVTVNPLPATISGSTVVCAGSSTSLSDALTGGAWTSSTTGVATVATTGVVTGVAAGSTTITYKLPTGCLTTTPLFVNALPAVISGPTSVCEGSLVTLSDVTGGGSWSSSNTFAASIGGSSGTVAGISASAGTSIISYTLTSTGCARSIIMTVNATPSPIAGATSVCVGTTTTLSDITLGGTWSSSNTGIATVSTGGVVTGISNGVATISYKVASGCYAALTMVVNPNPTAIAGVPRVCVGLTTAMTDISGGGGTWTSSNTAVGTVDGSGNVTGLLAGTTMITYTIGTGCIAKTPVTVNQLPSPISGLNFVCAGLTSGLSDSPAGGTWTSNNTGIASVSATGVVTGNAQGVDTINYTLSTGCVMSTAFTVNPVPSAISGSRSVCAGLMTSLSDVDGGGVWTSNNMAKATIGTDGTVTGVASGTSTISYTFTTGCLRTTVVTVNPLPGAINGLNTVCAGSSISLSDGTAGGSWSSSDITVGTVSSTGVVTGMGMGLANITYTLGTGCIATTPISVNPLPQTIGGVEAICAGGNTTLTDADPDGIWTSGTTTVATIVFNTGYVSGINPGVTNITYTLPTGCKTVSVVTVNSLPNPISGLSSVCVGSALTLSDISGGGTWASSNPGIGSIGAGTGTIVGESNGTVTITYTLGTGCYRTTNINVNPAPTGINGASSVCALSSTPLSDLTAGGTWSSNTTSVATIVSTTGLLSGVAQGTSVITYALTTGCSTTTVITVNPLPFNITGVAGVCQGMSVTLSDASFVGTWSSNNLAVGTIDASSGIFNGLATGTVTISYILSTGCYKTAIETVNQLPAAITGAPVVCAGFTTGLADPTPGGTWSSNNLPIAGINSSTGLVTGVSAGTANITYTITSSTCYNTTVVTVNPNPSPIGGVTAICAGSTTTLADATTGGSWSSSNTTIATIDPVTGFLTGVLSGTVTITNIFSTGCKATMPFQVNPLPAPITGVTYVCQGATTILHDLTTGGTWSSDNISVATVSAGSVFGVASGTATISYVPATGCVTSTIVTVNPLPGPINGIASVCTGATTSLSDAASGGDWTSSNTAIATAGTLTGMVRGVTAGSATITYTLGTGCYTTILATVNQTPAAITGPNNVCGGFLITLSDANTGGAWSSGDTTIATIGQATGIVVGDTVNIGSVTISYTLGGLCSTSTVINVNRTPSVIGGSLVLCSGVTTPSTLTDTVSGGTWSSSNTGVASVGLSTGIVTGVVGGTANISYKMGTGCYAYTTVTINTTPSAITGPTNVCQNLTINLTDAVGSGNWTSSADSIASIDASGVLTGGVAGSAVISYIVGTGCGVATTINVNPVPDSIIGALSMCAGATTSLSDATSGGIWLSSNTSAAPVDISTGIVSGIIPGTYTITYKLLATGCLTTVSVVVNPNPAPITGITNVCTGGTITLADTSSLGVWSSSNTIVATIGSNTGIVSGLTAGFTTITYTLGTGCYTTTLIRVNLSPNPVTGADSICQGAISTYSDLTAFGVWSSSDSAVAAINPVSGDVMGLTAGTSTLTYLLGTGCSSTKQMTVNPLPANISGLGIVCVGSNIFLTDATSGGVWTSTNPAIGSISAAGDFSGLSAGNDTLVYTLATGCLTTHFVSVFPVPTPIVGDSVICANSIDTFTSTPLGGLWSSNNTTVAVVGSTTGRVSGVAPGLDIITYTALSGCSAIQHITVNPVPVAITGLFDLCPGDSTTLFDSTGGGAWSSAGDTVATINADGTVVAIMAAHTSTISYTLFSDGCAATVVFTVNPLPYVGRITGADSFCVTSTTALSDSVSGGVWSSSDPAIASINASGVVTGVAVGTATISYIVTEQCGKDTATVVIHVMPLPFAAPIQGFPQMCIHTSTTLYDSVLTGKWSSSDTSVAQVDSVTGVVYGANPGVAIITYTYTNFCGSASAEIAVTVNATFGFAAIVTFPDSQLCSNTLYQNFGVLLPEPPGIAYHWSATNAEIFATASNGQYVLVNFPNAGPAVVKLSAEIISSGCSIADSFTTNVSASVSSNPSVQYYLDEFVCTDNTQDSYQWGYDDIITLDSTIIVGETTQDYYNPHPDTLGRNYWVITTKNGCSQKSYYTFSRVSGVSNITDNDLDVRLFPNPADTRLNIQVKGGNSADVIEVKLVDMLGKELETTLLTAGKGVINVTQLPSGVYSVVILRNGAKVTSKMFVKN